jgi:hypothetical protein
VTDAGGADPRSSSDVTSSRKARPVYGLVGVALIGVTVAAAGWYRATYYTWPFTGAGERVHWCDRDYESGPASSAADIAAVAGEQLSRAGRYPPLPPRDQVFVTRTPATSAVRSDGCPTVIYLRTGSDRYRSYGLLGGP